MNKMGFNFNKLADKFPYPNAFKTGKVEGAVIMTGCNHEEYFHAIEIQEAFEDGKRFVDITHDGLGNVRALYYNPKTKQYEWEDKK